MLDSDDEQILMSDAGRTQIPRPVARCPVAISPHSATGGGRALCIPAPARSARFLVFPERMPAAKRVVYILKSEHDPDEYDLGVT
jgi:hypothetical protein